MALTDGDGKLAAYYEYDAWGNTMTEAEISDVDNPYRYSTKEWDEKSGLYYFGARYYYPQIGRWTQRDPAGTVDGLNLYTYVGGEPVSQLDPWGHQLEAGLYYYEYAPGKHVTWSPDPEDDDIDLDECLRHDFWDCLGSCIRAQKFDVNKFLDFWGLARLGDYIIGVKAKGVGWGLPGYRHRIFWEERVFWEVGRRLGLARTAKVAGVWVGRLGAAVTLGEGLWNLAAEAYCSVVCFKDPGAY